MPAKAKHQHIKAKDLRNAVEGNDQVMMRSIEKRIVNCPVCQTVYDENFFLDIIDSVGDLEQILSEEMLGIR